MAATLPDGPGPDQVGHRTSARRRFEFLRNDAFNARNYFETTVPTYKKHDYGFTVGGPVIIPKLYNPATRKTFFFYSQEWRHEIVPGTVFNQQVPSDAERTGDFSATYCP